MGGERERALWRVDGPLHGRKNIPWAIATVSPDGRSFAVKSMMRDDARKEENMTLRLIAMIGWPAPAPQSIKVDAYYPELQLFFELHETQHADALDFRNQRAPGAWAAQRASDRAKAAALVNQGWYGGIVTAFDGPFYDPDRSEPAWVPVGNVEVRRRTQLAVRALLDERARNHAAGDHRGRVFLFSSSGPAPAPGATMVQAADPADLGQAAFDLGTINRDAAPVADVAAAVAAQAEAQRRLAAYQSSPLASATRSLDNTSSGSDDSAGDGAGGSSDYDDDDDDGIATCIGCDGSARLVAGGHDVLGDGATVCAPECAHAMPIFASH